MVQSVYNKTTPRPCREQQPALGNELLCFSDMFWCDAQRNGRTDAVFWPRAAHLVTKKTKSFCIQPNSAWGAGQLKAV